MRANFLGAISTDDHNLGLVNTLLTFDKSVEDIREMQKTKKIVFFGAGEMGYYFGEVLKRFGISPDFICDNNITKKKEYLNKTKIIAVSDLLRNPDQYYVIITIKNNIFRWQVIKQLTLNGINDFAIFKSDMTYTFEDPGDDIYRKVYFDSINEIFEDEPITIKRYDVLRSNLFFNIQWWHNILKWIHEIYKGKKDIKLLDVGPGIGTLGICVKKLINAQLNAVVLPNPNPNYKSNWEKFGFTVRTGYIEIDDFDGEYDIVVFTEVMEHLVYNPVNTLLKLKKLIKNDGKIFLSTPDPSFRGYLRTNFSSWKDIPHPDYHSSTLRKDMEYKIDISQQGHVYKYSRDELEEIFNKCGLVVLKTANSCSGCHNYILGKNKSNME